MILVLTHSRADYLRQTLSALFELPEIRSYRVVVSQDGFSRAIEQTVREFPATFINNNKRVEGQAPTQYIAQHYKFALSQVFGRLAFENAIILEDDMIVSPDFLRYFEATFPILDSDDSLWCISSWNDNCFEHLARDSTRLFRTSFFPGLGWLLSGKIWRDIGDRFPTNHWDHWMRLSAVSRDRDCIVPEVSRNYNIGSNGATMDANKYNRYFSGIVYNRDPRVELGDLSYLHIDQYSHDMLALVDSAAATVTDPGDLASMPKRGTVFVLYKKETFKQYAEYFRIWDFPRTHHRHLIVLRPEPELTVVLADARHSPYTPGALRIKPAPSLKAVASDIGDTCTAACQALGRQCAEDQFDFINNCDALADKFACERGFAKVMGDDIPNYVLGPSDQYYLQCLITDELPRCGARHDGNRRLCPCVS